MAYTLTTADVYPIMQLLLPGVTLWHYDGNLPYNGSFLSQIAWENPNVAKPTQAQWDLKQTAYLATKT